MTELETARQESFEERAAILEYDAGMTRIEAEAKARQAQLPQQEKQTPGYMNFRTIWHSRKRKHF